MNDKLSDQLTKRNSELQAQWVAKHELTKQHAAISEDQEHFQTELREQIKRIENELNNLTPVNRNHVTAEIARIAADIQKLQSSFTSATLFLTNYNVKSSQAILNDICSKLEATKEKLLGKKKFGFRTKTTAAAKSATVSETDAAVTLTPTPNSPLYDHVKWTIRDRQNEEIVLTESEVNDQDITVSTLENCCLIVRGHAASLQLSHLINCIVLCGPVSRSVFADNCTNCKLVFGCQQLRLHSSNHCDLYMHVTCRAIIEDCKNINVAPYNYVYANIDDDFAKAGLDLTRNNWMHVADFNWLSIDVASPNWQRIDEAKRVNNWNNFLTEFRSKILSR